MGYNEAVVTGALILGLLLLLAPNVNAVELRQEVLEPPYKSISKFDVTLDITLDQVYNKITPTTSTHYYIFRIHNNRATALNLSSVTKQFFIHLVTEGTPSNYRFFDYLGYRTAQEDGQTVYYTSWEETPFSSVYIPAGETKIFGIGFDINNPFAVGNYNISFTLNGQEYLIDPDISACGDLSADSVYTMTSDIQWTSSYCIRVGGNNITLNGNGYSIISNHTTGTNNSAGISRVNGSVGAYNGLRVANLTIRKNSTSDANRFQTGIWSVSHNTIIENVNILGYGQLDKATVNFGFVIQADNLTMRNTSIWGDANVPYRNVPLINLPVTTAGVSHVYNCSLKANSTNNLNNLYFDKGTTYISNSTITFEPLVVGANNGFWFQTASDTTVYLRNNTIPNFGVNFNDTYGQLYTENYVRFNFTTSGGTPQSSNFRLNNTLNGEIVNATLGGGDGGLSAWYLINDTKYNATVNTSYNPYTLNSHPSTAGYSMNASILSFTTTGTWNITFYSSGTTPVVNSINLCNGTACGTLGTLYYHSNALNASGNCTMAAAGGIGYFRFYRNSTLYAQYITYGWANQAVKYANTTVPSTAIVKGDTWSVGLICESDGTNSTESNSTGYTVNNTAPTLTAPTLNNTSPSPTALILCTINGYTDTDGDAAGTGYYQWWKNGVVIAGNVTNTLNLSQVTPSGGDSINCSTIQSDSGYSIKNSTEVFSTAAIVQAIPVIATTNLTYADTSTIYTLYTMQGLNCSFTVVDNDSATTNVTVRWYDNVDGVLGSHTVTNVANNTLTWATQAFGAVSGQLFKGRNVYCAVSATDGTYTTAYNASPQYTVNNTAPVIGAPSINNTNPTNTSIILCTNGTFSDIDYISVPSIQADPINNSAASWRWFKNGVLVTGFTTQNISLATGGLNASDGDIIICERTAYDSYYSPKASNAANSSGVTVGSTGTPSISLCSSGGFPVLNFSLFDEETLGDINGTMEATFTLYNTTDQSVISNASFTITNSQLFEFCINQYALTVYVDSFQSYYVNISTQVYPQRNYFLLRALLNASDPQTIPLYLENSTLAKTTDIYLKDQNAKPIAGAYIALQRYYPGTNNYILVAMAKTNDEGTATTYLRPRDPYYKPIVYYQNGTVQQSFTAAPISCDPYDTQCELRLQITPEEAGYYWQYYGKIAYNCSNVNASGVYYVACTFIDTSGLTRNFTLTGYTIGRLINQVCSNTTTSASGTLVCYLPNATGNYHYTLTANINPMLVIGTGEYTIGLNIPFGTFGVFLAAFIIATMGFVGLMTGTPAAVVVLTVVGVIASWAMNLLTFSISAIVGIVVLGVGLIVLLTRRS